MIMPEQYPGFTADSERNEERIRKNRQNLERPLNAGEVVGEIDTILDAMTLAGNDRDRLEGALNALTGLRNQIVHGKFPAAPPIQPGGDSLSRVALLFSALITADSLLSQAAADVLPARPGNITYRQHIERWLREASREEIT